MSLRLEDIQYLGFAREFGRGGKPQFFFYAAVESVTNEVLENLVQTYRTAEIQGLQFLTTQEANTLIGKSEREIQDVVGDRGLSEELRMNLKLAIDYIDNSRENGAG